MAKSAISSRIKTVKIVLNEQKSDVLFWAINMVLTAYKMYKIIQMVQNG